MAKKDSRYISGPIGQGTPFQQVYNSDNTPNYPQAILDQAQRSKESLSKESGVARQPEHSIGGESIKGLDAMVAKLEKDFGSGSQQPGLDNLIKTHADQKAPNKQDGKTLNVSKDEPEIDK